MRELTSYDGDLGVLNCAEHCLHELQLYVVWLREWKGETSRRLQCRYHDVRGHD
jgi:hypothetical protein